MLAFGLNKKLCSDFLKKQAVIGNLDEGELCWDTMGRWEPEQALYTRASHPVRRRASVTDTCLPGLSPFPNPWNSVCATGSCFC